MVKTKDTTCDVYKPWNPTFSPPELLEHCNGLSCRKTKEQERATTRRIKRMGEESRLWVEKKRSRKTKGAYGMRKGGPDNLLGHSHTKTHVPSTNCVGRISACGDLLSLPLPHFYMFFMVNFISPPLHLNLSLFILCQTSCIKCTFFSTILLNNS